MIRTIIYTVRETMTGCSGSPPRDPDVYTRTDHFTEDSLTASNRFLTERMIRETIANGRDCDRELAGRGNLRRKHTFDGVDAVLVLPENGTHIITGWTEINDLTTAATSESWSMQELEAIQAFEDQHEPSVQQIRG